MPREVGAGGAGAWRERKKKVCKEPREKLEEREGRGGNRRIISHGKRGRKEKKKKRRLANLMIGRRGRKKEGKKAYERTDAAVSFISAAIFFTGIKLLKISHFHHHQCCCCCCCCCCSYLQTKVFFLPTAM